MSAATRPKRATRPRVQEAHVFWISLDEIRNDYALWKSTPKIKKRSRGRASLTPVVQVGRVYDTAPDTAPDLDGAEFEFAAGDLEAAFDELASRKLAKDEDGDAGYGDEVYVGDSGLSLARTERHEYEIWAPCGESFDIRGGALRALVAAVRDLDVSTVNAV